MWNLDEPNQCEHLRMIAQNENSIKTAKLGHKKSTTRMFAMGLCVCVFLKKMGGLLMTNSTIRF